MYKYPELYSRLLYSRLLYSRFLSFVFNRHFNLELHFTLVGFELRTCIVHYQAGYPLDYKCIYEMNVEPDIYVPQRGQSGRGSPELCGQGERITKEGSGADGSAGEE